MGDLLGATMVAVPTKSLTNGVICSNTFHPRGARLRCASSTNAIFLSG